MRLMLAGDTIKSSLHLLRFTSVSSVFYLKLLDDAGEGRVVPAALFQYGHTAIILRDIRVKHPKCLPP